MKGKYFIVFFVTGKKMRFYQNLRLYNTIKYFFINQRMCHCLKQLEQLRNICFVKVKFISVLTTGFPTCS